MKRERTIVVSDRCRRPKCGRPVVARGLCGSCYQIAYLLVADEVTTWKELEDSGKVDARRRNSKAWFLEGIRGRSA